MEQREHRLLQHRSTVERDSPNRHARFVPWKRNFSFPRPSSASVAACTFALNERSPTKQTSNGSETAPIGKIWLYGTFWPLDFKDELDFRPVLLPARPTLCEKLLYCSRTNISSFPSQKRVGHTLSEDRIAPVDLNQTVTSIYWALERDHFFVNFVERVVGDLGKEGVKMKKNCSSWRLANPAVLPSLEPCVHVHVAKRSEVLSCRQ